MVSKQKSQATKIESQKQIREQCELDNAKPERVQLEFELV